MRYLLRRLGFFVLTLWAALTLNFFLPRLMPGSPASALRARTRGILKPEAVDRLLASFGFKPGQSLPGQYVDYFNNLFTGHWGVSIGSSLGVPVTKLIGQALPWTLGLVGMATVLAFLLGTLIGIVAGWRRGGRLDTVLPPVFVITSALPYFWVALMFILIFSVSMHGFLPNDFNYGDGTHPGWSGAFIASVLKHAILPAGDDPDHLDRRLDPDHAQQHDHHPGRGLRADGPGEGAAPTADHDRLRRPQRDPAQPDRLRHVARLRGQRRDPGRVRLQLPGPRLHAPPGRSARTTR